MRPRALFRKLGDLRIQVRKRPLKLLLVSRVLARLKFSFNSRPRQPQDIASPPHVELLRRELTFLALILVIVRL